MATSNTATPGKAQVDAEVCIGEGADAHHLQDRITTSSIMTAPAPLTSADSATSSLTTPVRKQDNDDSIFEVFRFFDLPREMRDKIYESVDPDVFHASLPCRLELRTDMKCTNLLAVSKQFRKEYEEAIARSSPPLLTITDKWTVLDLYPDWTLPSLATAATHVHINLAFETASGVEEDLDIMEAWTSRVLSQLTSLEALSFRLDVLDGHLLEELRDQLNERFWTKIPTLKRFDIYQSVTYYTSDFESEEPKVLLLEFSPEMKGLVEAETSHEWREVIFVGADFVPMLGARNPW